MKLWPVVASRSVFLPKWMRRIRELRAWLFDNVYQAPCVQLEFNKASHLLESLYEYFVENEAAFVASGGRRFADDPLEVSVVDFIAGMTDRFALTLYKKAVFA